jgi:ribosomal protein L37E
MSDADDTVTGVAIVRISACHRCGREVTVHLTGAVCACGVVSSLRDREDDKP